MNHAVSRFMSAVQHGQSSIEYLVVCAALAFALGVGMSGEDSVLHQLLVAFQTAYRRFSFALSRP
jgi:hypothetical protein